ncbi:ZCPW2 protein, partial [Amia calva]|nr:ZCPW2 protein [Amia calva]
MLLRTKHQITCIKCACLKWRLVLNKDAEIITPNAPWYCHMNPDPFFSSCLVPEEWFPNHTDLYGHGMKFVYSPLPAGSLVMIKASKWPWWPAILCPDPLSGSYVTYDTDGHIDRYHAEFLGNPHSRIWASARIVSPYPIPAAKVRLLEVAYIVF